MHDADVRAASRDGHRERFDHELLAHVIGDRPPDDPPAVAVHHRRQVQPALPRPDVGDIRAPQPVDRGRVKVPLDEIGRGSHPRDADRGAPPTPVQLPGQASGPHQPLDPLTSDLDAVSEPQLGVHARGPVRLAGLLVDARDPAGQQLV